MTDEIKVYKFKMGAAPYRHTGFWCPPSRGLLEANPNTYDMQMEMRPKCCHFFCDHCGTPITNHHIITDVTGENFVVGSSCIEKLNDYKLSTQAREAVNKRNREIAQAKRDAKREAERVAREAELDRQKEVNGGLTDWELQRELDDDRRMDLRLERAAILVDFTDVLTNMGGWADDVCDSMLNGSIPSNNALRIVCEIMAKTHGRKNSTKYNEAYPKYAVKLDKAVEQLEAIK